MRLIVVTHRKRLRSAIGSLDSSGYELAKKLLRYRKIFFRYDRVLEISKSIFPRLLLTSNRLDWSRYDFV